MLKVSGAYNQLSRILSWRAWRKNGAEPSPEEGTADFPKGAPKKRKSSLRRLTKIIHKRKTKDSAGKEGLVTRIDHGTSEEKIPPDPQPQQIQVACQTRLETNVDIAGKGACAKSANEAEFENLSNLELGFVPSQDESDDDSLLNGSGSSFLLDVALNQSLNTSIEVLEEVYDLLTDIARTNRDSQVAIVILILLTGTSYTYSYS